MGLAGELEEARVHVDLEAAAREQEGDSGEGAGGFSAGAAARSGVAAGAGDGGEKRRRRRGARCGYCCFVVLSVSSCGGLGLGGGGLLLSGERGRGGRVGGEARDDGSSRDVKGDSDEGVVGGAAPRGVVGRELERDLREGEKRKRRKGKGRVRLFFRFPRTKMKKL